MNCESVRMDTFMWAGAMRQPWSLNWTFVSKTLSNYLDNHLDAWWMHNLKRGIANAGQLLEIWQCCCQFSIVVYVHPLISLTGPRCGYISHTLICEQSHTNCPFLVKTGTTDFPKAAQVNSEWGFLLKWQGWRIPKTAVPEGETMDCRWIFLCKKQKGGKEMKINSHVFIWRQEHLRSAVPIRGFVCSCANA